VRLGRPDEAIRTLGWIEHTDLDGWAQGEAQTYDVDLALSTVARARLSALLRTSGRTREACAVARRVEELWRGAEPLLAAQRDTLAITLQECRQ